MLSFYLYPFKIFLTFVYYVGNYQELSNFRSNEAYYEWVASALNLLENYLGTHTVHYKVFKKCFDSFTGEEKSVSKCKGILLAAKTDYENGYLLQLDSLIKAEVIQDMLNQAEQFLEDNYKDAVGITTIVALQSTLKAICYKNDIQIKDDDKIHIKLKEANLYNIAKQKQIDDWLRFKDNTNAYSKGRYYEDD